MLLIALYLSSYALLNHNHISPHSSVQSPRSYMGTTSTISTTSSTIRRFQKLNTKTLSKVREALQIYRRTVGVDESSTINVPTRYVVPPCPPFPKHLWNLKLGSACHCIKYYKRKGTGSLLEESVESLKLRPINSGGRKFSEFISALEVYKSIYGDVLVPRSFNVPSNSDQWPKKLWGIRLGDIVASVRSTSRHNNSKCHQVLNDIGFIWRPFELKNNITFDALSAFKSVYGHLDVPVGFQIPADSPWPERCWGMKLGMRIGNVRYRKDGNDETRDTLAALGLDLDYSGFDLRHWAFVYRALKIYKEVHGHLMVAVKFVIPEEEPWPEELWGLKLGYRVNNIRYRGDFVSDNPEYKRLLDELGFTWKRPKATKDKQPERLIEADGAVYALF